MKKLFVLGVIVTLLTASASAQVASDRSQRHRSERGFNDRQLTGPEKSRLREDHSRIKHERRRDLRDGRMTHREKRRLHRMKRHQRHEMRRFKHNGHRRLQ